MLNDPIANSTIRNKASLLPCCNLERQDFIFALWNINIRESDNYSRNVLYEPKYKAIFVYCYIERRGRVVLGSLYGLYGISRILLRVKVRHTILVTSSGTDHCNHDDLLLIDYSSLELK